MNLKYQVRRGITSLKIILSIASKNMKTLTDYSSIKIYVNKIDNRIIFRIKTRYHLELLKLETMNVLGSTNIKIAKDKYGENVPHLEITEEALVHCDIVKNDYQQDSRVLHTFIPNKTFGQLLDISPKI